MHLTPLVDRALTFKPARMGFYAKEPTPWRAVMRPTLEPPPDLLLACSLAMAMTMRESSLGTMIGFPAVGQVPPGIVVAVADEALGLT